MDVSIELALVDYSPNDLNTLMRILPKNYFVEDRVQNGWGLVILQTEQDSTLNEMTINNFLQPLIALESIIKGSNAVLRVAIFYDAAFYTFKLSDYLYLSQLQIKLEVSMYPTDEE